jgi:hypothetical protein
MTSVDISSLVKHKTGELVTRPPVAAWAACASIWAREYVLAAPGWLKWPDARATAGDALAVALARSAGADVSATVADVAARLGAFDVEDDGSDEWQHVLDVVTMLAGALEDDDLETTVEATLTTYLEGTFTVLANNLAETDGRPISLVDAEERLAGDERWRAAVDLVRAV